MRPARWKILIDKSIAACGAAIEIYNKPVMPHREETFAILVVSAWELLLKAKLIKDSGNRMQAIYSTTTLTRKDGKPSKRISIKKNRAGNPVTISLGSAIHRASQVIDKPLEASCRENLLLLTDVRDNAVHFINDDRDLARRVHEIGMASIVNYVVAIGDWFDKDLGAHRFAILPLSFEPMGSVKVVRDPKRSRLASNLLAHMERACADQPASADGRFTVALRVETKIVGSRAADAVPIKFGKGSDAVKVELTEEEFRQRWPHDYNQLVTLLKKRVPGLRLNSTFNQAVKSFSAEERFAHIRRLDINNPKSSTKKKTYYSDGMVDALANVLR